MVVFAGQGDARRSMALLWRTAPSAASRPGPKPVLSVDAIVEAAVDIADAEGMAALSMRAVGERLGRTAMALYTHVPGKGELLDLMYDRVLAELPTAYDTDPGWRVALTAWAEQTWAFYLRHPWVLQISQARPVLGPNEYAGMEALVRVLDTTGLPPHVLRRMIGMLFHFVRGAAQTVAESRQAAAATGVTDDAWWFARSAQLRDVAPDFAERFPTLLRLETEGASAPGDEDVPYLEREAKETFTVGLGVLLDGIQVAVDRAAADGPGEG
ncbi:TetR/AcrR family transcriptional regulator [Streptomyces sp. NPDC003077]|uniref:TetR/AcrR family transcriptional regulator n=1 Tax=Streptomyces sp. NPDC003077 TaxID=3154443 RepID=UPI00339EF445